MSARRGLLLLLACLFLVSGATGLAAQVVFSRLLSYVFGASHLAASTVLAAYMAGLSLGALLVGRRATAVKDPIRLYGWLELGVACFLAMAPWAFEHYRSLSIDLARGMSGHPVAFGVLRFFLSFAFVLLPTILMGGTLPTLVSALRSFDALGRDLPILYGINTLGAAAGSLLSAYQLIPAFGLDGTLYWAALVNTLIAVTAFWAAGQSRWALELGAGAPSGAQPQEARAAPVTASLTQGTACALAFLQGAVAFTLEVTWSHLIGTVIGVTIYAFSLMLSAILLGIGAGSFVLPLLRRRFGLSAFWAFVWAEITLAVCLLGSLYLWDRFPDVITATLQWSPHWSFGAREAVRFAFVIVQLGPASLAMGVALPALVAASAPQEVAGQSGRAAAWVGTVFAANTVGAIFGATIGGFVLLGNVSSARILIGAAGGAVALTLIALAQAFHRDGGLSASRGSLGTMVAAGGLCLGLAVLHPGWDAARLTSGCHYYWQPWTPSVPVGPPVFLREDAQSGFISVDLLPNGTKNLKTNGKYEGSDSTLEFQDQFALIGALYLHRFDRAALVGLGPGRALALLHAMNFARIEVVEFSEGVIEAARVHFAGFVSASLADEKRVRLVRDDGRNHLQVSPSAYDLVVVGITGAAFAGVGNLYTREFFETVRSRLSERGIFLLWVQVHHVRPREVRSVVYTLRRAFPHVHFYSTPAGDQGFLVASPSPLEIDPVVAERLSQTPAIRRLLDASALGSISELTALNVFSSDGELVGFVRAGAAAGEGPELLTDFRPAFEYATPRGLADVNPGFDFQALSRRELPAFNPPLSPATQAGLKGLRLMVAGDGERALQELERSERLAGRPVWQQQIQAIRSQAHPE